MKNEVYQPQPEAEAEHLARMDYLYKRDPTTYTDTEVRELAAGMEERLKEYVKESNHSDDEEFDAGYDFKRYFELRVEQDRRHEEWVASKPDQENFPMFEEHAALYEADPATMSEDELTGAIAGLEESFRNNVRWMQETEAARGVPSESAELGAKDDAFRMALLRLEQEARLTK